MKKWMMMSNSSFYVDYLNREREEVPIWIASTGLLSDRSAQVLQEENDWCSLWCGKSFLVPTWIATWKLLLDCCAQKFKRRGFVQSLMRKRVSLFQCGFLHQDWFLTVLHRYYKRRKVEDKKGSREKEEVVRTFSKFNHNIWLLLILLFLEHVGRWFLF